MTPTVVNSATEQVIKDNVIYYFWGHCPICSKPEDHIELFDKYPVEVLIYEVFDDQAGRRKYDQVRDKLDIKEEIVDLKEIEEIEARFSHLSVKELNKYVNELGQKILYGGTVDEKRKTKQRKN